MPPPIGRAAAAAGALLVGVGVAVAVTLAQDGGGEVPPRSRALGPGPAVDIERVPSSWRITYRVVTGRGEDASAVREVVEVRRPFESRVETYRDDQDAPQAVQVASFGRLRLGTGPDDESVLAHPPDIAAADIRLDAVLGAAIEADRLERRGRREVAGRTCQVYRSAQPLGAGRLVAPASGSFSDACVDEAGLLLEERVVVDGDVIVHRVATSVVEEPELTDDRFALGEPTIPPKQGGGSVLVVADGSRPPGSFWVLGDPPASFERCGRFSVVPPQAERFGDPLLEGSIVASTADVWVHGSDVLVVDQGATLGGAAPFAPSPSSAAVDLGALGEGELLLGARGNEVRADLGHGRFVRVLGTLPPERLVQAARQLSQEEGGELDVEPDAPLGCRA